MLTVDYVLVKPKANFSKYLLEMPHPLPLDVLLKEGERMGVTPEECKRAIEDLTETGALSCFPPEGVKKDGNMPYVEMDGFKIYTHPPEVDQAISLNLLSHTEQEEFELKWMANLVREGDTVVDVGSNIGVWTIRCSKLAGPNGKVYAFEPEPRNFEVLKRNIVVNDCLNVEAVNTAVCDKPRDLILYLNPRNMGDHRIWQGGDKRRRQEILVHGMTLDGAWEHGYLNGKMNVMKIDTQGAEYQVLQGSRKLIGNQKRMSLFLEFWPTGLKCLGNTPLELERLLEELGFNQIYQIDEKKNSLVDVKGKLWNLIDPYSYHFTNLLCFKGN